MPIKPENKARYPKNWKHISTDIRHFRAKLQCEFYVDAGGRVAAAFAEGFERCQAEQYRPHPITGSKVVLTVAHLDHTPENCDYENLLAGCQRCHLIYDMEHHRKTREASKKCKQTKELFDEK